MVGLQTDSVIKSFGNWQILTDVYVSCKPGEIIGILGRNGCGKSTLMKIIFGSLVADRKFVRLDNRRATSLFAARNMISYLPQHHFLPGNLRIKSAINLLCDGQNQHELENYEMIKPFINKKPKNLSGGERRLVEILLIIHSRARYILVDEPFNGIAPLYIEEIKRIIKTRSAEKGFIITDHDYRNIIDLSTSILLIENGVKWPIEDKEELVMRGYLPETA